MRSPGGLARRALIAGLAISLAWMGGPADGQTTAELRQRLDEARQQDAQARRRRWEEAVAAYRRHWITYRAQGFWADFDLLQTGWRRAPNGDWFTKTRPAFEDAAFAPVNPLMRMLNPDFEAAPPDWRREAESSIGVSCTRLMVARKPSDGSWSLWRRPALNSAEEAVLLDRCTAGGSEAAKRRQALL